MLQTGNFSLFDSYRNENASINQLAERFFNYLNLKKQFIDFSDDSRIIILEIVNSSLRQISNYLMRGNFDFDKIYFDAFKKIQKQLKNENRLVKKLFFSCDDLRDFSILIQIIDEVNNEYR